jgi:hypothetical protein
VQYSSQYFSGRGLPAALIDIISNLLVVDYRQRWTAR